jgi:hypothetical protein
MFSSGSTKYLFWILLYRATLEHCQYCIPCIDFFNLAYVCKCSHALVTGIWHNPLDVPGSMVMQESCTVDYREPTPQELDHNGQGNRKSVVYSTCSFKIKFIF